MSFNIILKCLCSHFLFLFPLFAEAQSADTTEKVKPRNAFFMELGGPGFGVSLNYQFFISKNKNIHARTGLGFTGPIPGRDGGSLVISFPAGLNRGVGKNKKLELGAGCTFFYFTNTGWIDPYAFISFGYYIDKNLQIIISPFIGNASTINNYFNMRSPVFPYGGFNGTLAKKKIKR